MWRLNPTGIVIHGIAHSDLMRLLTRRRRQRRRGLKLALNSTTAQRDLRWLENRDVMGWAGEDMGPKKTF